MKALKWIDKAKEFAKLDRINVALHCINRALEVDPKNIEALFFKANIQSKLGNHMDALECYDRITEIDPLNGRAWFNKGAILGNFGQYREAKNCFDEADRKGHPRAKEASTSCQNEIEKGLKWGNKKFAKL